jgi:hypothetical protein
MILNELRCGLGNSQMYHSILYVPEGFGEVFLMSYSDRELRVVQQATRAREAPCARGLNTDGDGG